MADFIFLGPKITADGDCSHEIKRRLLLERIVMTNLDSVLKSRDITLSTEVHLVKAMVFPVVTYGCESWTIMKAERQRIDAFALPTWRPQVSERPSAAEDQAPKRLSEPDPLILWSRGVGGTSSLRILGLRQAGGWALLGYGLGKDTFPSPLTPFSPHLREAGLGSNGRLWLELE